MGLNPALYEIVFWTDFAEISHSESGAALWLKIDGAHRQHLRIMKKFKTFTIQNTVPAPITVALE